MLALEPESAAIFCKELALNRVGGVDGIFLRAFDPGEKYIVVDCGGEQINIDMVRFTEELAICSFILTYT